MVTRNRLLDGAGAIESNNVVIVNEAFARKFNLGRDPVGKRIGRGNVDAELTMEIVGLVKDAKHLGGTHGAGADLQTGGVKNPVPPQYVLPSIQMETTRTFYARTTLPPDTLLRSIPTLMARLDPDLPVNDLTTLPQLGARSSRRVVLPIQRSHS